MEQMDLQVFATETQTTNLAALSDEMKTYYEKRLIDNAEPNLVHDQFGDKYPIPEGSGKTIEFRRYSPLPKALTAITEGVTPDGDNLQVSAVTATVAQYGNWIRLSDMLELSAIDRNVEQATKLLGAQAGRTLDTITREELNGGTNVLYAPKGADKTEVSSRSDVTADCRLDVDLFYKAAAQLEAMNASPIDDSFVAIIHPYSAYDLMRSEEWIDCHKYAAPEYIYNGEIGKLGNIRFVKSTEAKIWGPTDIVPGYPRLTVKTAISASATSVTVKEVIPEDACQKFAGPVAVYLGGAANTVTAVSYGAAGATLTLGTAVTSVAADAMLCGQGGGKDGSAVFSTLVLGANAYGTTELENGGLEHIVKQLGYGDDPLNQRSSVGWKATKAAKRLVEAYMVRIESGNSYSDKAKAN